MYQEIKPSERISAIIESFWVFSKNEASENFKVLPDTCTDLIFDLNQNRGFLSGIMTHYQFRKLAPKSDLIGVRFKAEKFGFLSKTPLYETKNARVELCEIVSMKDLEAFNQLNELSKVSDKIVFLENRIESAFKQNLQKQDHMVLSVAQNIREMQGVINVGNLAKSYHISLRQLERRFKRQVGLTIKEFSNIVRFNSAKKSIAALTNTSLLEIACDMGFSDHSHMTHEFKRISGEYPSYFR